MRSVQYVGQIKMLSVGPALDHHSLAIWAGITAIGKPVLSAAMAESF